MSYASRTSPNSQHSASSNIPVRRLCGCLDEADVFTSGTDDNPCRRFYRCPNRKVKDCGLFDWIDPALPEFQRTCFIRLKAEKKALEEKLRAMEKQHNDRSGVKEVSLSSLEELENKVTGLEVDGHKNAEVIMVLENKVAGLEVDGHKNAEALMVLENKVTGLEVDGHKNAEVLLVLEKTLTQVKNLERKMYVLMIGLIVVVMVVVMVFGRNGYVH
ncbi:GRF zinc finger containing protein [Striga asiatica]|uniref:GRF zinc finger containing protein n=1 Tax=Striga asiatica TaxID=4170 RepID=A0A5A7PVU2_STRAF|nr:GRF zinc finger containing protein [Striga asiatica]